MPHASQAWADETSNLETSLGTGTKSPKEDLCSLVTRARGALWDRKLTDSKFSIPAKHHRKNCRHISKVKWMFRLPHSSSCPYSHAHTQRHQEVSQVSQLLQSSTVLFRWPWWGLAQGRERNEVLRASNGVGAGEGPVAFSLSPPLGECSTPLYSPPCSHSSSSVLEETAFRKISSIHHLYLSTDLSLTSLIHGSLEMKS